MAEPMTMTSGAIRTGIDVYTVDGDKLGAVKEVRGGYFKIDAKMQGDYWLEARCVQAGAAADRLTVSFDTDHLGEMKRDLNEDGTLKTEKM